ncbi:unnamed protein product [Mesocestoides corti]|uniref:Uncharacterized protein n=1 Tax=Mesocestoides corti TaxID=53468 RepID=A0A0R3UM24_MESCO|nr:unnamed protein product [Mesocestoides corti]
MRVSRAQVEPVWIVLCPAMVLSYFCFRIQLSEPCFSFVVAETVGVFLQIVDCDSRHTHNGKIVPRALPTVTFVGVAALDPDPEFTMTFKNLSKMINCPSRLNFIYENGALKILNYNLRHNHLLSPVAIPKDERPKVASRRRFHLRQLCSNNTRKISVPQAFMSNSWSMEPVVTAHVPNQPDPFLRGSADRELPQTRAPSRLRELMSFLKEEALG